MHRTRLALRLLLAGCLSPLTAAADDCVTLDRAPAQGALIWGQVAPGSSVSLDGEALTVLDDGWFLAGFGRSAGPASTLLVRGARRCERRLAVAQREYRIQRVDGVPQQTVTPPPERLARIRREQARVSAAKRRRVERPAWLRQVDGGFAWPARGPISGIYGSQRIYNGTPGTPHYGVDVAAPAGTPVVAPAAGLVTLAEPDLFYSGGTVILDHGYGLSSSFLHMSEVSVAVGDELARGDRLGAIGASGRATGPHLDWRMSWRGRRVDPQRLVPPMPKD